MSIQVVRFEVPYVSGRERFAIWHSNSETMFAPVFHDEFTAEMFVIAYEEMKRRSWLFTGLCEQAQLTLAHTIHKFVRQTFPLDKWESPALPEGWALAITEDYKEAADYDFAEFFSNLRDGRSPELPFLIEKLIAFQEA